METFELLLASLYTEFQKSLGMAEPFCTPHSKFDMQQIYLLMKQLFQYALQGLPLGISRTWAWWFKATTYVRIYIPYAYYETQT